jgi:hypothetical protein
MGLLLFLFILLAQIGAYLFVDKKQIKYGRTIVLIPVLLIYFVLLPYIYYPEPSPNGEGQCGMPLIGMFGVFWIFGGGITILADIIYALVRRNNS